MSSLRACRFPTLHVYSKPIKSGDITDLKHFIEDCGFKITYLKPSNGNLIVLLCEEFTNAIVIPEGFALAIPLDKTDIFVIDPGVIDFFYKQEDAHA